MGRRLTHRSQSQDVTPAKVGVHIREELDSPFRGNDATFDGGSRKCLTSRVFQQGFAKRRPSWLP